MQTLSTFPPSDQSRGHSGRVSLRLWCTFLFPDEDLSLLPAFYIHIYLYHTVIYLYLYPYLYINCIYQIYTCTSVFNMIPTTVYHLEWRVYDGFWWKIFRRQGSKTVTRVWECVLVSGLLVYHLWGKFLSPVQQKLGIVVDTCNPSTHLRVKAGGSKMQGYLWLSIE